MKYSWLIAAFVLCFLTQGARSQNLVPNPGFENYSNCPSTFISMPFSKDYSYFPTVHSWTTPLRLTTPDYLNSCAPTSSGLNVPNSTFGYQLPQSGAAYAGIIAFQGQFTNGTLTYDYREYLQIKLSQPMVAGKQYCVKFFVSPTISSHFSYNYVALDEIGINFSGQRPMDTANRTLPLPYHVKNAPGLFLTDSSKWYNISGIYNATGGENWLTLGTFQTGNPPAFVPITPAVPNTQKMHWSYLYIDDVSVVEVTPGDSIVAVWDTTICLTSGFSKTFYGPANGLSFEWQDGSSANQLTATDTGVYWCKSKTDCGLRLDTFRIKFRPSRPLDLGRDTFNCLSLPITLSANHNYDAYSWNTGASSAAISATQSGIYILTVSDTCGIQQDTIEVTIQAPTPAPIARDTILCQYDPAPVLDVKGNDLFWYYPNSNYAFLQQPFISTEITGSQTLYVSQKMGKCESVRVPVRATVRYKPVASIGDFFSFCTGADTLIGSHTDSVRFLWNTGDTICCIRPQESGIYTLTISNACGASSDSALVEIFPCDECLLIPNAFTPNKDGRNDFFVPIIKCPVYNFRLRVFNRWGELVFDTNNPAEGWDGRNRADQADAGVYVYILEYNSAKTKSRKTLQGNVTLIR